MATFLVLPPSFTQKSLLNIGPVKVLSAASQASSLSHQVNLAAYAFQELALQSQTRHTLLTL
jgi:hypothetical protein